MQMSPQQVATIPPGEPPPGAAAPLPGAFMAGEQSYASITDRVVGVPLSRATWRWVAGFGLASSLVMLLFLTIGYLYYAGIGIWGVDIPVAWGFAIVNFVWWIGIGHAGTLISAILLLLRQSWRNSISRLAEAMTIFAVANAGLFPLLHLGRIFKWYYLIPYPDTLGLWPQWRSPLVWDVFAVGTYFTVSLLFWYLGLVPDFASMRDSARRRWAARLAGIFALGWRGSARHWQNYSMAYLILAGLATPLVVSVHSIVSMDFATAIVPGWHTTIFPPYFVAGAIFSGFAMVLTIAIPLRSLFGVKDLITVNHLNSMAKLMLATGLIVAYGYVFEAFTEWYSGDVFEHTRLWNRIAGPYAADFWLLIFCNVVAIQLLWFRWFRTRAIPLFIISIVINVGMWLERYDIITTSLRMDFTPSAWGFYTPTRYDWAVFVGTLGFFIFLVLLFVRVAPALSMFELREQWHRVVRGHLPASAGETLAAAHDAARPAPPAPPRGPDTETATVASAERGARTRGGGLYGLMASFRDPEALIAACRRLRESGYTRLDAFAPFPVDELPEVLALPRSKMPLIMLIGGLLGGGGAYFMQWYAAVADYPWNIGGRPAHSWPSFVPLTFELTVLGSALAGFFGVLALSRLPKLYHPVFNVSQFSRASRDRFVLVVKQDDPRFSLDGTGDALRALQPVHVSEVPITP